METATTNCSVSVAKDGVTIALKEDNDKGYSHAERLHVYIEAVLAEAQITMNMLDAIAVSKGPGSYTGLRIGVSAAKGLCYAINKPLISVPTLEALAHQVEANQGVIVSMLDARRMEVYSAIYDYKFNEIRKTEAQILEDRSFEKYLLQGKVFFVGNGVAKTVEIIKHPNAIFIEDKLPSSKDMSALSFKRYKKSDTEDVAYFEPYYLKDFVAIKAKPKH
ncbi:tRNA (adenosine(37)-N6)-threonylcarbamoyltransferase complex dimerization subunit type 1 TsaB [Tamlana fucoidanivorans]|uniref:N(6)-L-threonylcarbamoyladenine synthase n=1 Tax=Allotamlana fucoidanivorans TaxID=2583814 RepID=A0A5C4SG55_9FLAO|nr:tRNA (adenosine(37)-N6)-threonylcarbamoyltransferase complex dimerization subunit type 1 TsaB [Tamlana fucoidanivorans]